MVDQPREGTKFGRYALLDKIGTGGMAEIFRAKTYGAAGFEKEFAIKLILPSLVDDTEFVEMFINEAKIAVSLYHANIVQVFDLGELDGQYYIAMEYVLGKDLLDVLARCADYGIKIPLNLVLFVTMEMLKGLNFAHRAKDPFGEDLNIIHRDVSPSNILISYAGDVKVGDFGVAKAAIQRNLTESGTLKGKVGYMSPEQVMGEQIDSRSDIFAAGVVFFEAISMSRLFSGGSDLEVMLRVRDADIAKGLEKAEPLPADLKAIIHKALAKHPEERFQTSGEFYQALVDFCYQHSIKVTGTDLSNFMRRLFAKEIEEEKTKRRAEPRLSLAQSAVDHESVSQSGPVQAPQERPRTPASTGAEPESEPRIAADAKPADQPQPQQPSGRPGSDKRRYRYRDASGLIYGPMGLETLRGLVSDRAHDDGDQVSINGGTWRGVEEVEEVAAVLAQAAPSPEPTKRAPSASTDDDTRDTDLDGEKAVAHSAGEEHTTLPDEDELAAAELEAAVSAMEEISMAMSSTTDGVSDPSTIPFELSSSLIDDESSPTAATAAEEEENTAAASHAIQQLKEQYASYEGKLAETPFARILARLYRASATGRLHLVDGDVEKSVFFRKGEPVLVNSNKKSELLGSFLRSREIITEAQLREALDRLSEWGGRLGDALVAIGAIPAHDIFRLLAEQMREKLLDVFTWKNGGYGYYENQEPDTMGYPLGVDAYSVIVEGCRAYVPLDRIEHFYAGQLHTPLRIVDQMPVELDRLKLDSRELRVFKKYTRAGTSVADMLDALTKTGEDREFALRTTYLLHQVECISSEVSEATDLPDG